MAQLSDLIVQLICNPGIMNPSPDAIIHCKEFDWMFMIQLKEPSVCNGLINTALFTSLCGT